ncbi:MAG: ABC transporter ATP-binding protein [Erysipelotrichaceae bacterium]|nr:ABC transporter ATP-binding protein [Erysipelotrichaceae bacterium]
MIEFKNISKSFKGGMVVLKDISFTVDEGDIIRITGPNGCGKSTLLKIACGLMKPDCGTVIYDKYQNEIGAVIENPCFIEDENLLYNLKFLYNLKNSFYLESVLELCHQLNLDLYNKMPMKKYSIGMRQKAGFIQSIMENQKIIYLDEPTRGMDEESVIQFYNMISSLHDEGKTIIICSHEKLDGIKFNKEYVFNDGILFEKE